MKEAVHMWLAAQRKTFFSEGLKKAYAKMGQVHWKVRGTMLKNVTARFLFVLK
jgi:hypothetical protein